MEGKWGATGERISPGEQTLLFGRLRMQNRWMTHPTQDGRVTPFCVVFVCTGNICRAPMADVVFRDLVSSAGLSAHIASSSAGTGEWHVGERADQRTLDALEHRGLDGSSHRARQFSVTAFDESDLIVALDRTSARTLRSWARTEADVEKIALLLSFDSLSRGEMDVPDPYYADAAMFDEVLGMIERACRALFRQLEPAVRRSA